MDPSEIPVVIHGTYTKYLNSICKFKIKNNIIKMIINFYLYIYSEDNKQLN